MRRARAVELEEERRRERLRRKAVDARVVGVEGRERRRVQQLAARDGHAVEPQALDGLDGGGQGLEAHRRRGDVRRRGVQRERDLRDDAERALGPDEEPREVVARRRLARAAARLQHRPVREDDGQAEDGVAHRAVAHGRRARRAAGRHAADGRVRARVDHELEARVAQRGVDGFPRRARLRAAVHVAGVLLEHGRHLRADVDGQAAPRRLHVALEARAHPKGHDGRLSLVAELQQRGNFLRRRRERDDVGRHARVVRLVLAVARQDARVRRRVADGLQGREEPIVDGGGRRQGAARRRAGDRAAAEGGAHRRGVSRCVAAARGERGRRR